MPRRSSRSTVQWVRGRISNQGGSALQHLTLEPVTIPSFIAKASADDAATFCREVTLLSLSVSGGFLIDPPVKGTQDKASFGMFGVRISAPGSAISFFGNPSDYPLICPVVPYVVATNGVQCGWVCTSRAKRVCREGYAMEAYIDMNYASPWSLSVGETIGHFSALFKVA